MKYAKGWASAPRCPIIHPRTLSRLHRIRDLLCVCVVFCKRQNPTPQLLLTTGSSALILELIFFFPFFWEGCVLPEGHFEAHGIRKHTHTHTHTRVGWNGHKIRLPWRRKLIGGKVSHQRCVPLVEMYRKQTARFLLHVLFIFCQAWRTFFFTFIFRTQKKNRTYLNGFTDRSNHDEKCWKGLYSYRYTQREQHD